TAAVPISAEIQSSPVDFEITESVTMAYSGSGNDLIISDIIITNNKAEGMNLVVDNIAVEPIMGWNLAPAETDFSQKLNKKEFAISTGGHDFSAGGYTAAGTVEEGQSLTLSFTGKAGAFSSKVSEKAANFIVTVSLEEALKIVEWSTGTDAEIVAMVAAADAGKINLSDYWDVGDERQVSISAISAFGSLSDTHAAQTIVLVLMNKGGKTLTSGKECNFIVGQKDCLADAAVINASSSKGSSGGWADSDRRTWCNNAYYNAYPASIKPIFKKFYNVSGVGGESISGTSTTSDYFALLAEIEVYGSVSNSVKGEGTQFTYYQTATNRKKKNGINGGNCEWWLRSPASGYPYHWCTVEQWASSPSKQLAYSAVAFVSPFGCI
ncbi:MAG: hypothetical protein IJB73_08975, partial [Firmicutes bacterium]|nr:hypothetical protein [Bacillota bacterium]